jgi:hypothetical protein
MIHVMVSNLRFQSSCDLAKVLAEASQVLRAEDDGSDRANHSELTPTKTEQAHAQSALAALPCRREGQSSVGSQQILGS